MMFCCSSSEVLADLSVVLLELLQDCQEHGSATSVHALQEPKGPVGPAVISKWRILTNTLVHSCHSNICINVMGKLYRDNFPVQAEFYPCSCRASVLSTAA